MGTPALARKNTTATRPLEYNQLAWGDLIYGTKEQLTSLGIVVTEAFPGAEGRSRNRLVVTDPRGFKCQIEPCRYREPGVFCVSIPLPGRKPPEQPFDDFAPGVLRQENTWTDDYLGSAEALFAAGLIRLDQLPGQPGMRKAIVTILPDGSLPTGAPTANSAEAKEPGAKSIKRASKNRYQVSVFVDADERSRRYAAYAQSRREWEDRMRSIPRPPPLHARLVTLARKEEAPASPARRTIGNVIFLQEA